MEYGYEVIVDPKTVLTTALLIQFMTFINRNEGSNVNHNMACSKEEIERKRLAAIQKRLSKSYENIQNNSQLQKPKEWTLTSQSSNIGPVKTFKGSNTFHPYAKPESSKQAENAVPVSKVVSGTVYLISEHRFEVNPSEFCTPLINIFKSIPSRNYGKVKCLL